MTINLFKCKYCLRELQPENICVYYNKDDEIIRVCGYCGDEVEV